MSKVINMFDENEFKNQKICVYKVLLKEPLTMLEIASLTNIRRANICRYISEFEELGIVAMMRKRKCTISGYPFVGEYTADKSLFPEDNQLNFDFSF